MKVKHLDESSVTSGYEQRQGFEDAFWLRVIPTPSAPTHWSGEAGFGLAGFEPFAAMRAYGVVIGG